MLLCISLSTDFSSLYRLDFLGSCHDNQNVYGQNGRGLGLDFWAICEPAFPATQVVDFRVVPRLPQEGYPFLANGST